MEATNVHGDFHLYKKFSCHQLKNKPLVEMDSFKVFDNVQGLLQMCQIIRLNHVKFEPRHDKTNKVSVRQAKTQISLAIRPVWSESSLYAQRWQRRLWSDWADAQADLSLWWAHTHFVGFVMSQLI